MNRVLLPAALLALLLAGLAYFFPPRQFSPSQTEEIEAIVERTLVEKPEILIKVSQSLQAKERDLQKEHIREAIQAIGPHLTAIGAPSLGNEKGSVVIVEFLDYQCIHCKRMEPIIEELIAENPDLKVIVKPVPIFGKTSEQAAKAALASYRQGKLQEMQRALFNEKGPLTDEKIFAVATAIGLDTAKLQGDMSDPKLLAELNSSIELAKKLGINATPFFLVIKNSTGQEGNKAIAHPGEGTKELLQGMIDKVSD